MAYGYNYNPQTNGAAVQLPSRWLITMAGHITCVIDGICYDTFDPTDRFIWCAYQVK